LKFEHRLRKLLLRHYSQALGGCCGNFYDQFVANLLLGASERMLKINYVMTCDRTWTCSLHNDQSMQ